jgi:hypothetical protein
VLYEEKKWPKDAVDLINAPYQTDFDIVERWQHNDTGEVLLLKLKKKYRP